MSAPTPAPETRTTVRKVPAQPPLADCFDLVTGLVVDLADKVALLVAAALGAMFPHGEHLLFSTDDGANLRFVEIRDRAQQAVYRFSDEQLPELPAALAAEFGGYCPRRAGALEVLLSEALDFGADPDGLEPVGSGGLELLPLWKPSTDAQPDAL
jgi:hypothetical protein